MFGFRVFDNPKPVELIKDFISIGCNEGIFLDFFSGSNTSSHSLIELNFHDKNKRTFIEIQLPEEIANSSESFKNGYSNIAEIGKERIRRVVKKIKEEN